jgi:hypothetical protein
MVMADLYLIAHKVRGEGTIDIATPLQIGQEEGWIIPTSGHRAYPYWTHKLDDLFAYQNVGEPPADLRDHYPAPADYTDRVTCPPRTSAVPTLEDL